MRKLAIVPVLTLLLAACSSAPIQPPGDGHLRAEKVGAGPTAAIPAPVQQVLTLPAPKPSARVETYSVSVVDIPLKDLLFALARDAKLNVDVHPGIDGRVTLNAIDQTLQQLLARIAKQADMRWEIDGTNLVVMPDSPFLRTYKVDYVNMSRDVSGTVSINTQIASTSAAASTTGGGGAVGGGNNSSTSVTSKAKNNFWDSVEKNIKDILRETDKILPAGSSETVVERLDEQATTGTGAQAPTAGRGAAPTNLAGSPNAATMQQNATTVTRRVTFREAASVIVNPEAGVIVVRATSRQHEKVQEYLDQVLSSSRRQVMIEATIAEVSLNDQYQQGINWSKALSGHTGLSATQYSANPAIATSTAAGLLLNYLSPSTGISSTLKMLETFGNVKVLSSPKISVLNNQTAMLKVVDNIVYFTVKADTTTTSAGTGQTTVTTTPNSVSVGLVMSVTPQISDSNIVLINVRPTISRLKGDGKQDPNPNIPSGVTNMVPEIQTREMESMLRLVDGEIAVMGGLMSDELNNTTNAVPLLSKIPALGNFFTSRNDVMKKTELVIFLKPTIIRDPSIYGDYKDYARQLPNKDFFANNPGPLPPNVEFSRGAQ